MDAIPPGLHRSSPIELQARLAAERRGRRSSCYRDGADRQRIVELERRATRRSRIGRQPASDVALTWDDEVSRAHADVECIGDVWTLVDDGRSRNGSYVNGERVHGRRALRDGDVIASGDHAHVHRADREPRRQHGRRVRGAAPQLSAAQRRVLVALCRPFAPTRFATPPSNRELAAELYLSVETVKFHLHALFELFGIDGPPSAPEARGARAARAGARRRRTARRPAGRVGGLTTPLA